MLAFLAKPIVERLCVPIAVLIALAITILIAKNRWDIFTEGLVQQGIEQGYSQAQSEYEERTRIAEEINRAEEKAIQTTVDRFIKEAFEQAQQRQVQERVIIQKRLVPMANELPNDPICTLPPEMVEARNAIRALGPQGEEQ